MQNLSLGSSMSREVFAPVERHELPTVVKETILPSERVEVQPVVHRDIEQTEVHEVLQPMKEREIAATNVVHTTLPAEVMPEVHRGTMPVMPRAILPESFVAPVAREQFEKAPIIEETIHKKIIEEVQPVLYKEVVQPVVIEQVQPIYERVVEAPVYLNEERSMQDLGVRSIGTTGFAAPSTGFQSSYPERVIHERTTTLTETPLAYSAPVAPVIAEVPVLETITTTVTTDPYPGSHHHRHGTTTTAGTAPIGTTPVAHEGLGTKLKHALHMGGSAPGRTDTTTPLNSTRTI
jgi:hypothetical protein